MSDNVIRAFSSKVEILYLLKFAIKRQRQMLVRNTFDAIQQ